MNALTMFVRADWAERMSWTLLHSLWQIALVVAAYAVAAAVLRNRSAGSRYVIGCAALCAMLGLPMGTYVLVPRHATPRTTDDGRTPVMADSVEATLRAGNVSQDAVTDGGPLPLAVPAGPTARGMDTAESAAGPLAGIRRSALRPWLPWATAAWLVGVLLLSLRPFWGWLHVRRLQRCGLSPLSESLGQVAERVICRLGVRTAVRLAQSALVEVPTVVGYLRPMVLLPASPPLSSS